MALGTRFNCLRPVTGTVLQAVNAIDTMNRKTTVLNFKGMRLFYNAKITATVCCHHPLKRGIYKTKDGILAFYW
jgi:hypothetical protein